MSVLNGSYSDGAQVVWEDGERVFFRGWRRDDSGKRRPVLIAVPAAERPSRSSLDRLAHEYELRDELDGAWAVRPLEIVRDGGRPMLVLEDTGGEPADRLIGAPVETGRFLRLAIGMVAALGKLHQRGFVHKDVKPANILLNEATGDVRLTGFGIASRLLRERQSPDPPETIAGTLAYMAPEQTGRMNRSIDSRSDLYALGVSLYQIITGALPFTAADPTEWVHCHLARKPVAPAERQSGIPGVVSAMIMKLLAKRAEDRYQTAAGLESDLRRCLAEWEAKRRIDEFPLGEHDTPHRLVIPEKLYGRRREVETLLAAFDRVASGGAAELVLVSGDPGLGKSSLVNELQKVVLPPRGLFASGKFDQNKQDIPYTTFAQAFQRLVGMILAEPEAEHARYRDAILAAVEPCGQFIINLTPQLERVIGKQPPISHLAPQDALRVFQQVLRRFIGVFARPGCPLVLFLDDLQWLDTATLEALQLLLLQEDINSLLVVGAYRGNEIGPEHPLVHCVDAIRQAGVPIIDIQLVPLALTDLRTMIAETLHEDDVLPLTELVHDKTAGNPFFATQFFAALADDGLIAFEPGSRRWIWDGPRIASRSFTDNVVELMIRKILRLPARCREALQAMACIGNTVRADALAAALDVNPSDLRVAIRPAVDAGLVTLQSGAYAVLHDRIQEASYALISEAERPGVHLRVGRRLLASIPPEKLDETLFEIVNQLNRGIELVGDRAELDRIAELNVKAGQRAKAATAHVTALALLRTGADALGDSGWQRQRALAFTLAFEQAECEFLMGDLEQAEVRLSALVARAEGPRELAAVACLRMMLYVTRGEPARSVAVCLEYLENEGIRFTPHPSREDVESELARMWQALGARSVEDLAGLPETTDPATLATLDVLAAVASPAWFTDQLLPALIGARIANISIDSGNGPASSFGYAMLGMKLGPFSGDYRTAYRFGKLALELAERGGNPRTLGRVLFGYAGFTRPWTDDLSGCRELLERGFEAAERAGDVTYATYLLYHVEELMLIAGLPLEETEAACRRALSYARKLNFDFAVLQIQPQLGLTRMLQGDSMRFGSFDGPEFNQDDFERVCSGVPALSSPLCRYWFRRQQAHFLAGDASGSVAAAEAAGPLLWCADVFPQFAEHHFYGALARAESLDSADEAARAKLRQQIDAHLTKLAQFAENSPVTFGSRAALAAAEVARVEGREPDAMTLYERAIRSARTAGFVHIEALSFELAARFHAARGFETIQHAYLREARSCYRRWGAAGKVRQLETLYPFLREPEPAHGPAATIAAPVEHLDFATVVKVSQAVSGETVREKLIDALMRLSIEHAGAERGLLLLSRGNELRQEAEAITSEDVTIVRRCDDAAAVPDSLVRYVTRTREVVIVDDASTHPTFSSDPYLRARNAKSILCLPLVTEAKLAGVLYLENNLAPHVFTPSRIAVLKLLALQAAISLENTFLYRDLAESEAKFRDYAESASDWLWEIGPDYKFKSLTGNAFGSDPTSRVGTTFWGPALDLETEPEKWRFLRQTLDAREPFRDFVYCAMGGGGRPMYVKASGKPVFDPDGEFRAYRGIGSDVTATVRAERAEASLRTMQAELAHVTRVTSLGQLTASIAHEVNQPIAGVLINAATARRRLARDPPDTQGATRALDRIVRDGERAADVISRTRAMVKKSPTQNDTLKINEAISEVIGLATSEMSKNRVEVQTRLAEGLPLIKGDRVQLQQVVLNLIMNAVEAMSQTNNGARELLVSTRNEADGVLVAVRDSGPGLPEADLDRVFEAFYTTKSSGLGMGLAICRSIVEAHGGRLWADANMPNGAVFRFTLPITTDSSRRPAQPRATGDFRGSPRSAI